MFDTEVKLIFDFLENHYHTGAHFVIEMRSALKACGSCDNFLKALQEMAKADGKTIEIVYKADSDITGIRILKEYIDN